MVFCSCPSTIQKSCYKQLSHFLMFGWKLFESSYTFSCIAIYLRNWSVPHPYQYKIASVLIHIDNVSLILPISPPASYSSRNHPYALSIPHSLLLQPFLQRFCILTIPPSTHFPVLSVAFGSEFPAFFLLLP